MSPTLHFLAAASPIAEIFIRALRLAPAKQAPARRSIRRTLAKGCTLWIDRPLNRHVVCEGGVLWLTFDNEPCDIILEPGDIHACRSGSRLSIHALADGAVGIDP